MDGIEAGNGYCLVAGWTVARCKGGTERFDNNNDMVMLVMVFDR